MKEVVDDVRVAVASVSTLGESPFWHPGEQALFYVDIVGHRLQRFDPRSGELRHWEFDSDLASIAPKVDGSLIMAMRSGLWHFDPATGERDHLADPPYDPKQERFNDGKCDPQGRFWVGTVYGPREPALATLSCYANGTLTREIGGVTTLNGLAWSPNGRTMHWSDTHTATIFAADFDPATGGLSRQRVFASFPAKQAGQDLDTYGGRPDGAAMDAEGCYWAALFEGQRVVRLSPDGELLREIVLPARCPTMPCFGGSDLKTLYITTSRENRPAAELIEQPYAGCVFAIEVDVPGLPVNFAV
jgi:sugar lactone lactonase YvrE